MVTIPVTAAADTKAVPLSRGELFAGLFLLGCANGLFGRAIQSVHRLGWMDAAASTFDISVIVLGACFAGLSLLSSDRTGNVRSADLAVAAAVLLMIALPIGAGSWLAITLLGLYVIQFGQPSDSQRRGAVILFAVTVPMLWSRLIFDLFAKFILSVDAALVAWVLGTHRAGNMVEFADHSGTLAIFPACSSLANVSLALLCWVAVSQSLQHKWRPQDIFWCALACSSVVAVNVIRISLMGVSPSYYQMIHEPIAEGVVGVVMLTLIVGISLLGARRDAVFRL